MSVKLSELLDLAGEALDENAVRSCAKALRAIAPALVEFIVASEALEKADDESTSLVPVVAASRAAEKALMRLRAAMKEAGVTCE